MRKLLPIVVLLALALVLAAPAYADSVTLSGSGASCGGSNCLGNVITLTITPTGGSNYTVTLAINTSGNTSTGTGITGVNFGFGNMGSSATLTSAPGGTSGWGVFPGSLSANGCGGSNGNFICNHDSAFVSFNATVNQPGSPPSFPTALASLPNAGTYTWIWDVTSTGYVTGNSVHVGALFGHINTAGTFKNGNAKKGIPDTITYDWQKDDNIVSASAPSLPPLPPNNPVPEPSSLVLLGTGLFSVAGLIRRRLVK